MQRKQILVVVSSLFYSLGVGYALSTPLVTVLLSTGFNDVGNTMTMIEEITHNTLIHFVRTLASALGFLIIAIVMQIFGRKVAHIVLNVSLVISLALSIIAKHLSVMFLAQVIQGISITGIFVKAIILSEYCHKKRRGLFMSLEKSAEWIGGLMCHLLSSWISWRYVCLIGTVSPCISIALTIFWPESPYFHAMKGQYEECTKSFHLLHGESEKQRRELHCLISVQQKKLEQERLQRRSMITNTFRKFLDKSFWKVFLIMAVVISLHSFGNLSELLVAFYSHRVILFHGIINGYLMFYILMISASLLSCFIILIERRTVLFVFGFISVAILFLASIVALRVTDDSNRVLSVMLGHIGLYHNFFINLSVMPVCAIIFGELYFLEHKGIGVFASGIVFVVLQIAHTSTIVPLVVSAGLGYTILNAVWLTALYCICLTILFFILPETKDKTLQEIENKLRGKKIPVAETSADNVEMGHGGFSGLYGRWCA